MKSLLSKILISLVISVLIALALVMLMTRMNMKKGVIELIERQEAGQLEVLVPELTELYQQEGSWDFLKHAPRRWNRLVRMTRPPNARQTPPGRGREPGRQGPGPGDQRPLMREHGNLRSRLFLLDENRQWVAGAGYAGGNPQHMKAIEVDGSPVGWLGFIPLKAILPPEARLFLHGQARALLISLVVALTLAVGLGFLLARHFSRPLRQLAEAVDSLSNGDYSARAPISTLDEIGKLGQGVNQLAETLEKNRSVRRRWMADVAHELRTPVAVLKGEIEALEDGLRPTDEKTLGSLREEAEHLSRLVSDLQTLALSDSGALDFQMETLDLSDLLRQVADSFAGRLNENGVAMKLGIPDGVLISGDAQRLRQLLQNLLENSSRYVETNGRVQITLMRREGMVEVTLDDSGPGLQPDQVSRLFERFYRAEGSRSRASGGSGLGLSICRNIAEAHHGSIVADRSPLGGLGIRLVLPG